MKQILLKTLLLLSALVVGLGNVWATDSVTLVSGSGTSGYAVPTGWTQSGTVEGGSYLKFDNGTITSPSFEPHNSLSFTYTVATFGSGTNHPLTIRILNASTDAVIKEETTATPTSTSYISTGSPIDLGDIDVSFKIQLYGPTGKGVRLRNYSITGIPADDTPACATGIDLSSSKTLTKGDIDVFSATCTPDADFTGTITYTYESSDTDILDIDDDTYSAEGVGVVNVTITATPTGGNAASYKAATQIVAVTVNGTNSITLDPTSKTVAFSTSTFNIAATVPTDNYNGTVTAASNNTSVATVSVDGTTVTVTPVAVGTATITVTAGTGTYYPIAATETCVVTVTGPTGVNTSTANETVFYESFDQCEGTGGNDGTWSSITGTAYAPSTDESTWAFVKPAAASHCARFGTGSALGSATTPSLTLKKDVTYTLTFKAGAWNGTSESTNLKLSATNATLKNAAGTAALSSVTMTKGAWTSYTATLTVENNTSSATVTFEGNSASNSRFFLDEVLITRPLTSTTVTTTGGLATYCYLYPLDLDGISGAKAYKVSSVDVANSKVMMEQITGTIKGGVPFILKSDGDDATFEIPLADESDVVPAGNALVGTLAPTFVTQVADGKTNFAYSKSNECFVKIADDGNTVPANRAYLPVNLGGGSVKAFTLSFSDEDGISEVKNGQLSMDNGTIYNLAGQRVNKAVKGIYIMNGKKYIVK